MKEIFDPATVLLYLPKLLSKLPVTLLIVVMAWIAGMTLGLLLAAFRLYRVPVLNQLTIVYVSFMRGTPIVVQMFLVYYGLPMLLGQVGIDINRWDKLFFVIVTYGLHAAAFHAEIFRAAIGGVPRAQAEAASSVGLSRLQAFRRIIAPQAALAALPGVGIALAHLVQETSLAFTIGIVDVMGEVRAIGSNTHRMLEGYAGAAVIFLVLTLFVEASFSRLERTLRIRRGR